MHLASKINRRMALYDDRFRSFVGRDVKYTTLCTVISDIVRPFGAKAVLIPERIALKKHFEMSGQFQEGTPKNKDIQIHLHAPTDRDSIVPTPRAINLLRHRIVQVLQHELNHRHQYERRIKSRQSHNIKYIKFSPNRRLTLKQRNSIKYFTEHDEIDSYARDIAYEVKHRYPHLPPREVLAHASKRRYLGSLKLYTKTFRGLDWSIVRETLLRKVYKWLPDIQVLRDIDFTEVPV